MKMNCFGWLLLIFGSLILYKETSYFGAGEIIRMGPKNDMEMLCDVIIYTQITCGFACILSAKEEKK